jgi:drug/metabolite transporter (DMT)-like permease
VLRACYAPGPMEDVKRAPSPFLVHGGLLIVQLGFASHHVASKMVVRELPPTALALVRAFAATVILLAIHVIARRSLPRVPVSDLPKLAGCAFLGIAANQILFFEGLARTTAINASLLTTTIPVFVFALALVLGREKTTLRAIAGIALALGGVIYLLGEEAFTLGGDTVVGDLLVAINSLSYAAYMIFVIGLVKKHGSLTVVVWLFFFGTLWIAPFGAIGLWDHAPSIDATTWALVAWIILAATVVAYLINAWALAYAPPSVVGIYIYLQPLGAALLAVLVLHEELTSRAVLAAALVFAGIFLVARKRAARPVEKSP